MLDLRWRNMSDRLLSRWNGNATGMLAAPLVFGLLVAVGCGTTRTTNTARTATEQLLISDAIDRAVQQIDFTPLAGQSVYVEEARLAEVVDKSYLIGSMRQHMLASGCVLKTRRDEADYIIEPRAGAVGTDNHDLLFGIPATNVPQIAVTATLPAAIPEIAFAKRRNQRGVAKLAVFAYLRETGEPVWQSGIVANESTANDIWLFGAGPFNRGTIYDGTRLAGKSLLVDHDDDGFPDPPAHVASMSDAALFPKGMHHAAPPTEGVVQASATEPAAEAAEPQQVGAGDDAQAATRLPAGNAAALPPPAVAK
ncbi:MAG: hypothetical protein KDA44_13200 [Planctomycetales bacterium]|nr:hypothetical protein [Planctomycetales bacterium]